MNNKLIILLQLMLIGSCQFNNLEKQVDCSVSDLEFTITLTNTDCGTETGSIEFIASKGVPPYTYGINGATTQDTPVFSNLAAGEYNLIVTDNNGCSIENKALIANKNGLSVSATTTDADCGSSNGSISIAVGNGVAPYQYQLNTNPPQSSPDFTAAPGIYTITVTDVNGCEFSISKQVFSTTSYLLDIKPILMGSCIITGCHNGSNSSLPNFSNLSTVQANASMIKSRTQSKNMPKTGSLTQGQIDLLACWVDDGAKDN